MDIVKSNIVIGISAAIAATIFAPVLIPVVVAVGRPFAKSLVRGGMVLYEKSLEATALAGEAVEDLIAEVRTEKMLARATNAAENEPLPEHYSTHSNGRTEKNGVAI